MQRTCERQKWLRFCFIGISDRAYPVRNGNMPADEINAACNTTIVLARMLRVGRKAWHMRQ